MIRCAAVLATHYRYHQPWIKCCENHATTIVNGHPLCGTHINRPPERVVLTMLPDIITVEKIDELSVRRTPTNSGDRG